MFLNHFFTWRSNSGAQSFSSLTMTWTSVTAWWAPSEAEMMRVYCSPSSRSRGAIRLTTPENLSILTT